VIKQLNFKRQSSIKPNAGKGFDDSATKCFRYFATGSIISAVKLAQGHEESFKKQQRLLKAWEAKRANSAEFKMTSVAPLWLELSEDRKTFNIIPERAEVIKRIFELKLSGFGTYGLTKMLNKSNCWRPQGTGRNQFGGWHRGYIEKVLRSRAVLGEFQPHKVIDRKRKPIGDPITDYFPRIFDDDTFFAVQEQFARNKGKSGKNGKLRNLFGGLAKCGYCSAPMQYVSKGKINHKYLVCDNARRGLGCKCQSVQYQVFEDIVLKYCKGLDPTGILPDSLQTQSEILGLQNTLSAVRGRIMDEERKIGNLTDAVIDSPSDRVRYRLQEHLDELMEKNEQSKEEEKRILCDIGRLTSCYDDTQKQIQNILIRWQNI
jgi:hypothetical protein